MVHCLVEWRVLTGRVWVDFEGIWPPLYSAISISRQMKAYVVWPFGAVYLQRGPARVGNGAAGGIRGRL